MSKLPHENNETTNEALGMTSSSTSSTSTDGIQRPSVDPAVIKVELFISRLLRIGVVISLSIMVTGVVLGVIQNRPVVQSITATSDMAQTQPSESSESSEIAVPDHVGPVSTESSATSAVSATPPFVPTLRSLPKGMVTFDGIAWMTVGLLVLIATPVLRVAISALLFARMGDRMFVGITLFVLAMLVVSFFLGHGK